MQNVADQLAPTTIRADLCAIFISLELSRSHLAGYVIVARPRREDVKAQRVRRGYRCAVGPHFGAQEESVLIPTEAATFNEMMSPLITR